MYFSPFQAQPKHLSCIAVSAFHLSCRLHRQWQEEGAPGAVPGPVITVPDTTDLTNISQSRCSASDLQRMQSILASRVKLVARPHVSALTFLRLMYAAARAAAAALGLAHLLPSESLPNHLVHQLEITACDSLTLSHRPAEVALALLAAEFQRLGARPLMGVVAEIQKACGIQGLSFAPCLRSVVEQLENYNGEGTVVHRQKLVWKLSNRTLRHLRPTDKLRYRLPTIQEKSNPNGTVRMR